MTTILSDVYSLFELNFIHHLSAKNGIGLAREVFPSIENLVLCESILVEPDQARRHIGSIMDKFPDAIKPLEPEAIKSVNIPSILSVAGKYPAFGGGPSLEPRVLFYLDLSKKLGVYFAPHPDRQKRLHEIGYQAREPAAARAVKMFDREMSQELDAILGLNVDLPPVVEHVTEISRRTGATIAQAIAEVRNSKNAASFRKWCSEIDNQLLNTSGRSQALVLQPFKKEIEAVAGLWAKDLQEGVKYKKRKISLNKIWGIGSLLEAVGLDSFEMRDPILSPDSGVSHLLFLNDFYRGTL